MRLYWVPCSSVANGEKNTVPALHLIQKSPVSFSLFNCLGNKFRCYCNSLSHSNFIRGELKHNWSMLLVREKNIMQVLIQWRIFLPFYLKKIQYYKGEYNISENSKHKIFFPEALSSIAFAIKTWNIQL